MPERNALAGGPVPVLRGARVTLRPPTTADADDARRVGMHPEIWRCFGEDVPEWRELAADEARATIARLAPADGKLDWVIDAGDGFVGTATVHSPDPAARSAAYAIGILAPDQLGHGLGTETTRLVLAHAFDDLGLDALTTRVLEFNARAIACYAGAGFVFDHREPDAVTLDGTSYADVIMLLDVERYRRLAPTWAAATEPPELY